MIGVHTRLNNIPKAPFIVLYSLLRTIHSLSQIPLLNPPGIHSIPC